MSLNGPQGGGRFGEVTEAGLLQGPGIWLHWPLGP